MPPVAPRLLVSLLLGAALLPAQRGLVQHPGERRLALVIGNNAYPQARLVNAVPDARAMAGALGEVGFGVSLLLDATREQIEDGAGRFASRLRPGDVALVFYAGHGAELAGENYLIPVDLSGRDVRGRAVRASFVLEELERSAARLKILVLDACRDNPYRLGRGGGRGLAGMQAGTGTFLAFATAPGQVADDNAGGSNGLFTTHLLAALRAPGLTLDEVFGRARQAVYDASGRKQLPWTSSSVIGDFVFRPGGGRPAPVRPPAAVEAPERQAAPVQADAGGLPYRRVPAGTFLMGCSVGDAGCYENEGPRHEVTVTRPFWIGQTEVTVAAYQRFAKATGRPMPPEPERYGPSLNPGWREGRLPMVNVDWNDASAYCRWAGGRLPTEAEWEHAARGGTAGPRYGPLNAIAWTGRNSTSGLHEAGGKAANAYGLHDMMGNVWEWVADWYAYYIEDPETDPTGPVGGDLRVARGGSTFQSATASTRVREQPGYRAGHWGFRCVLE